MLLIIDDGIKPAALSILRCFWARISARFVIIDGRYFELVIFFLLLLGLISRVQGGRWIKEEFVEGKQKSEDVERD